MTQYNTENPCAQGDCYRFNAILTARLVRETRPPKRAPPAISGFSYAALPDERKRRRSPGAVRFEMGARFRVAPRFGAQLVKKGLNNLVDGDAGALPCALLRFGLWKWDFSTQKAVPPRRTRRRARLKIREDSSLSRSPKAFRQSARLALKLFLKRAPVFLQRASA